MSAFLAKIGRYGVVRAANAAPDVLCAEDVYNACPAKMNDVVALPE